MHIAINDGCSYAVYYVDANGGFATDYGIPTLRAAERIACVRDVQEARHPSRPSHRCVRRGGLSDYPQRGRAGMQSAAQIHRLQRTRYRAKRCHRCWERHRA